MNHHLTSRMRVVPSSYRLDISCYLFVVVVPITVESSSTDYLDASAASPTQYTAPDCPNLRSIAILEVVRLSRLGLSFAMNLKLLDRPKAFLKVIISQLRLRFGTEVVVD